MRARTRDIVPLTGACLSDWELCSQRQQYLPYSPLERRQRLQHALAPTKPAVNGQYLAADVACPIRSKKDHRVGDILIARHPLPGLIHKPFPPAFRIAQSLGGLLS